MIRGFFSGLALSLSLAVVPQAQADGRLSNVGMVRDNVNNILDNSSSHELIVSALVEFRNVHGGQ
jgi:hypothetical protein